MQQIALSLGVVTSVVCLCMKYISSLVQSANIAEKELATYVISKDILGTILLLLTLLTYMYFAYKIIKRTFIKSNTVQNNSNSLRVLNSNRSNSLKF